MRRENLSIFWIVTDKVKDVAILEKCCEKMQEDQLDILIGAGKSFFETEEFYKKYSYYEKVIE